MHLNSPHRPTPPTHPRRGRYHGQIMLAALTSLALLSGCASAPLPELKPPLPANWQQATATGAKPIDLHGWWRSFHDPQLDALVERALEANLEVAEACERLRAARLLQRHSGDAFRPEISARTTDAIDPDGSASFFIAGFDANWELGLFGARKGAMREAQGQWQASLAELHAVQVSLVAEVTRQWVNLRSAQAEESIARASEKARQITLRIVQQRSSQQLLGARELSEAEANLARSHAALSEPRQAINASAQQLALLLGQNAPDPAWLDMGTQPQLGAIRLQQLPADLLRSRPEIASAEAQVIHAAGTLGLSRAQLYPHLALGSALQWSTDITSYRHTTSHNIFSVGPIINIPLFDWGRRMAIAHASGAELNATVYAYRQAVLQGVSEVETALGDLEQSRQREHADEQAAQALARGVDASRTRMALQLISPLEVQQDLLEQQQAARRLIASRQLRDLAFVALYKAFGGAPLPPRHLDDDRDSPLAVH